MKKPSHSCAFIAGFLGFFAVSLAHAMPTIGDDVIFSSVRVNAGAVITGTFEMKLVSFNSGNSGDSTSGKWTEKQTTTENGVAKVQNQQIPGSALLTDSAVALILTNCTTMGGTLQTVTVPAGSFPTCAIPIIVISPPEHSGSLKASSLGLFKKTSRNRMEHIRFSSSSHKRRENNFNLLLR